MMMMMIQTCILMQIVGRCAVGTTNQLIALNEKIHVSVGETRNLDHIILRKAQGPGDFLSVVFVD